MYNHKQNKRPLLKPPRHRCVAGGGTFFLSMIIRHVKTKFCICLTVTYFGEDNIFDKGIKERIFDSGSRYCTPCS